jgi:hypothetical protein
MSKTIFDKLGNRPKDRAINMLLLLVVVAVLIFGGYFGIRFIVRKIKEKNTATHKELNESIASGVPLSFSETQYQNMSDTLYAAMNGVGTNEGAIFGVFESVKNISDVLKLIDVFGLKKGENLGQWLKDDLSTSEIAKINNTLKSKGINYQF